MNERKRIEEIETSVCNIKQLGLSRTRLSKQYIMGFCMIIIIIIIIIIYRKLYIEPPLWAKPF